MRTPPRSAWFLAFACTAATASSLAAQARGPADSSDEQALRARVANCRARLERLVELRIRMDLGIPPPPGEIASHAAPAATPDPGGSERALATEQRRLAQLRQRFSELARGGPAHDPGDAAGSAIPLLPESGPDADPDPDPDEFAGSDRVPEPVVESRPAAGPVPAASRPASRSADFVQIDPGALPLGAILALLETGNAAEAAAAQRSFQSGQAGMAEFVAGLCAERAGDLDAAERSFEAAAEKLRNARVPSVLASSLEQSIQLALDHTKWKKERLQWRPPSIPESAK
jgi:hypothetical protein